MNIFKNDENFSFLNIFIFLVFKHYQFTSFISLFRPLGYSIKPRPTGRGEQGNRGAGEQGNQETKKPGNEDFAILPLL